MFVKKKDGTLRLCVDYRKLNDITVKDRTALPLIPELLDRLHAAKIFTKIDLRNAYNQLRIKEGDEYKTAFGTRYDHFESLVVPFGTTGAPAAFQRFMSHLLRDFLDRFAVNILDDITIYSDNLEDHIPHVKQILQVLRDNRLFAKIEKCDFHKDSMDFLGYVISTKGIGMDLSKVNSVLDWPAPTTVKHVQAFLGFANFYRKFIQNFSSLTQPLTDLTKASVPFTWSASADKAFSLLKLAFTSAPVLAHFQPHLPITVEADASDFAMGVVLSQTAEDGTLRPVAYWSRKFIEAEKNYL